MEKTCSYPSCSCTQPSACPKRSRAYYPVMLDLRGKRVVFIGGGFETETKVRALLAAEAQVTLISPENHPDLYPLPAGLIHLRRGYQPGDLEGFMLAISHPVNRSLNAQVATEARQQGVWLNAVDDPAYCDFILPAVHRQGDLIIAVSTSGSAPALGVRIKARLAKEYGPEYAEYLRILREFRPVVAAAYPEHFEARKAAWYRLVDADALSLIRLGRLEQARELLRRALEEAEPQLEVV